MHTDVEFNLWMFFYSMKQLFIHFDLLSCITRHWRTTHYTWSYLMKCHSCTTCYSHNNKFNIKMSNSETAHHERLRAASPTVQPQLPCLLTVQPLLTQSAAFRQTSLLYWIENMNILHWTAWNTVLYVIGFRGEHAETLTKQSVVSVHLFTNRERKRKWF